MREEYIRLVTIKNTSCFRMLTVTELSSLVVSIGWNNVYDAVSAIVKIYTVFLMTVEQPAALS